MQQMVSSVKGDMEEVNGGRIHQKEWGVDNLSVPCTRHIEKYLSEALQHKIPDPGVTTGVELEGWKGGERGLKCDTNEARTSPI